MERKKQLIVKLKELQGQSGVVAYDRAVIVVELLGCRDFIRDEGQGDIDRAVKILESYVEDLILTFHELKKLLTHYPKREQWASGKLRTMYKRICIDENNKKKHAPKPQRTAAVPPALSLSAKTMNAARHGKTAQVAEQSPQTPPSIDARLEAEIKRADAAEARCRQLEAENARLRKFEEKYNRLLAEITDPALA